MWSRKGGKEMDMTRCLIVAAFVLLSPGLPAQSAAPGNAENGKRLFLKNGCYECHGTVGQGAQANPLAPRLAPRPIALAALIAYVRKPGGGMPPYVSKVMSDAELADVRAYLASIPEPPPVKSIALLNP
jgi:ubiquinol-cytochrome c reductase cytochrome c subunit